MKTSTLTTNVNESNTSFSFLLNGVNYDDDKNLNYLDFSAAIKWDLEIEIENEASIVSMFVNFIDFFGSVTIEDRKGTINNTFFIDTRKDVWELGASTTTPIEYPCHPHSVFIDFDKKEIVVQFYG